MSEYAQRLVTREERAEFIVRRAVQLSNEVCGPVAHLVARAYVHSLGGSPSQADEAERRVRELTGVSE